MSAVVNIVLGWDLASDENWLDYCVKWKFLVVSFDIFMRQTRDVLLQLTHDGNVMLREYK